MSVVYTGGTFDLLHAGHIDLLRICKKVAGDQGDVVIGLNRDDFVVRFKGKPPVCSYEERAHVLKACVYVDEVVENVGDADSKIVIDTVKPDFILIGDDWATRDYYKQMSFTPQWLDDNGITLLYVPRQRKLSSTEIKDRTYGQLGNVSVSGEPASVVEADVDVPRASN